MPSETPRIWQSSLIDRSTIDRELALIANPCAAAQISGYLSPEIKKERKEIDIRDSFSFQRKRKNYTVLFSRTMERVKKRTYLFWNNQCSKISHSFFFWQLSIPPLRNIASLLRLKARLDDDTKTKRDMDRKGFFVLEEETRIVPANGMEHLGAASLSLSLLAREKRCASVERQRERKRREKMRGAERSGLNRGWIRGNGVLACRKFRARARCYGVRVPRVWHEVCQIAYKRADPLLRPRAYRIGHSRVYTANTIGRHRSPLCCAEKRRDRERERERVRNDRPRLSRARHLILGKGETRLRASARQTPIYLRRHVWVNGFCR